MNQRNHGYSLVELMVVMVIFSVVTALCGIAFKSILAGSTRETRTSEGQVADLIGLELLRSDIEHAGFGLFWSIPSGVTINYVEAATTLTDYPVSGKQPSDFNDSPSSVPKMMNGDNEAYFNGSDYLVIKSTLIARNSATPKWSYIVTGGTKRVSSDSADNLSPTEKVIAIRPVYGSSSFNKELGVNGTQFYAYSTAGSSLNNLRNFYPTETSDKRIFYGLADSATTPRMPFNRADYYIKPERTSARCAPNTGVLTKGVIRNTTATGGGELEEFPIMDCVADFQIVYGLASSSSSDNSVDTHVNADGFKASAFTPAMIRSQLKEVWVFILTHDGAGDRSYKYPNATIPVGATVNGVTFGRTNDFDLTSIGTDATTSLRWDNYRWKVITMVVKPKNL